MSKQCPYGKCKTVEYRVAKRDPDAEEDPGGAWIRTVCKICGRWFGYRPADVSPDRVFQP